MEEMEGLEVKQTNNRSDVSRGSGQCTVDFEEQLKHTGIHWKKAKLCPSYHQQGPVAHKILTVEDDSSMNKDQDVTGLYNCTEPSVKLKCRSKTLTKPFDLDNP